MIRSSIDWAKNNPLLFYGLWRWREHPLYNRRVVRPDFDLVIEGFPRSGNTFCTAAFKFSQAQNDLKIANHFHTVAQFKLAARWRVPALLVIRPPTETILSNAVYQRSVSVAQICEAYVRFHRALLPLRPFFVVGQFAELIADFGAVTARINQRFGTDFRCFEHTPDNVEQVFRRIAAHRQRLLKQHDDGGSEFRRSTPSAFKQERKALFQQALDQPDNQQRLHQAEQLYTELTTAAKERSTITRGR